MKFIYRLDSVGSPVFGSSETFEMELEDSNARAEQSAVLDTLTTPLNTQLSDQANLKPLDTEDLTSANAHYTLEDFFNSYNTLTDHTNSCVHSYNGHTNMCGHGNTGHTNACVHGNSVHSNCVHSMYSGGMCRNESIDDVCEAGFDFSKLFTSDESPIENSFQSLIDLVRCEIPANLSSIDPNFKPDPTPLNVIDAVNLSQLSEEVHSGDSLDQGYVDHNDVYQSDVYQSDVVVKAESHKTRKSKKKRSHFSKSNRLHSKSLNNTIPTTNTINTTNTVKTVNTVNTGLVVKTSKNEPVLKKRREMVNSRRIDYGINDTVENIYDLEWHPGFTRHLGAKGRSALLELVRKVYRQDPEHYKAILQSRNSPSSISSLPFYSIPMLWELAHQFGIFKQALTVYKTHCFSKSKSRAHHHKHNHSASSVSTSVSGSLSGSHSGSGSVSVSGSVGSDSESLDSEGHSTVKRTTPMTTMSGRLIKRSKKMLESADLTEDNLNTIDTIATVTTMATVDSGNLNVSVDTNHLSTVGTGNLSLKVDLLDNGDTVNEKLVKSEISTPKRVLGPELRSNSWSLSPSNTLNCADTFTESPLTSSLKRIPV